LDSSNFANYESFLANAWIDEESFGVWQLVVDNKYFVGCIKG
jgi:hypothetical protein